MGKFSNNIPSKESDFKKNPLNKPLLSPASKALKAMIEGWMLYARFHRERYGQRIGDDEDQKNDWINIGICLLNLIENGNSEELDIAKTYNVVKDTLDKEGL